MPTKKIVRILFVYKVRHENIFDALNFHAIKSYIEYLKCVFFIAESLIFVTVLFN